MYQLLAILLPLVTIPYVSRVLGPERVGEYAYSYSIAYYFVMLAALGLNNYGNRSIARIRDDKAKLSREFLSIYYLQLGTSLISIAAYLIFSIFISNLLMSWFILPYVISAMFDINWFFFGLEQFKKTVIRNSVIKILTTICIFIFIKSEQHIYLYAAILSFSVLLSQLMMWPYVKKYVYFVRVSSKDVMKHFKPNFVLFVPILSVSLYKVMDKIMLGSMTSMVEVGLFESAERIIQIPMALIVSLGTVMMPKMANLIANDDEKLSEKYFKTSIMFAMFLSSSMCFGIMSVAKYFVPLFYGIGYEKNVMLFQILLPSCLFLAFANVIRTQYLIPRYKDEILIKSVLGGALVNLSLNYFLIPRYESVGAAIGTLVAEVVVCVYQAFKIRNHIQISRYVIDALVFVIPGIIMYSILLFLEFPYSFFINIIIMIAIGMTIYFSVLGIIFVYSKNTRTMLKDLLKR